MRICIVNSFYYPDIIGGAELSVLKLAEELTKKGHEIHVICTGKSDITEIINNVNIHRIKINNIYSPITKVNNEKNNKFYKFLYSVINTYNIFNYKKLSMKLKEINPNVVHVNNIDGISPVIWSVCKKINIPIVQTLRDYSLLKNNSNFIDFFRGIGYKYLTKEINCVTAPSQYTLKEFTLNGYFENSKKQVIYNAIDYEQEQLINIRDKKIIKKDENIDFVFLGRLDKGKGIEFLVDAFCKINNKNINLYIAGNGECKEHILNKCKIDERIKYLGFLSQDKIEKVLANSEVLIIPSLWPEPFGRVIIEAYKFSMPVIGSRIGGIPEIINDNTGVLIDPGNEEQIIRAINYFSARDNVNKYIRECCNEIKKYDINKQGIEFIKLYESLINL